MHCVSCCCAQTPNKKQLKGRGSGDGVHRGVQLGFLGGTGHTILGDAVHSDEEDMAVGARGRE